MGGVFQSFPELEGIGVDESSNVFITGNFAQNTDFDPSIETFVLEITGSFDRWDPFILKLQAEEDAAINEINNDESRLS